MDELQSGEAETDASAPASAFARNRTRVLIAGGVAVAVIAGLIALLATRDSGGSNNDSAGAIDGTNTTLAGAGPTTSGRNGTTVPGSDGPTLPGDTLPGGGTVPGGKKGGSGGPGDTTPGTGPGSHRTTPTTRPGTPRSTTKPPPTTGPPMTIAPTLTGAYTAGYQAECRHIWAITADADGLLWDADWLEQGGVKVDVCYQQEDATYAASYDTPADAQQGGTYDADSDMSDWTLGGTLINTSRSRTWSG